MSVLLSTHCQGGSWKDAGGGIGRVKTEAQLFAIAALGGVTGSLVSSQCSWTPPSFPSCPASTTQTGTRTYSSGCCHYFYWDGGGDGAECIAWNYNSETTCRVTGL